MNELEPAIALLDRSCELLQKQQTNIALNQVYFDLWKYRNRWPKDIWQTFCTKICRDHPLTQAIHTSPISHRAYTKPRGYAGDAILMDYLYEYQPQFSSQVYNWEYRMLGPKSVRSRRFIIADIIKKLVVDKKHFNILSLACGHMREAFDLPPSTLKQISNYYGLDADEESLHIVDEKAKEIWQIKTVKANVVQLLKSDLQLPQFDLAYTLGLSDYLKNPFVKKLIVRVFSMLVKGGKFIIANFTPNLIDSGYIETFMDWHLFYRDEQAMISLLQGLPPNAYHYHLFRDEFKNIVFLEVTKL
ncbi:MAG: hypothetical protein H6695_01660 [Deferribacteres bacterium]|nr:hypothetical protein [candidate division KSB1 bacterium]MCB9508855.1 hypothetical protein [Deferribacteres bacterium]